MMGLLLHHRPAWKQPNMFVIESAKLTWWLMPLRCLSFGSTEVSVLDPQINNFKKPRITVGEFKSAVQSQFCLTKYPILSITLVCISNLLNGLLLFHSVWDSILGLMHCKTLSAGNILPLIPVTLVGIIAGGKCAMAHFKIFFIVKNKPYPH